ncbi:MAG: hypothetical protein IKX47_00510 [Oscillospiraceae bacterium]|nr:hypothetical protein [Oscillospiraceae bacterium]
MRKPYPAVLALVVCLVLLLPTAVRAEEAIPAMVTNNMIVVSNSTDAPDAHPVHPAVYKIEGSNYFKLRDLAMLLNGSGRQFSVGYDNASKTVSLTTGESYAAVGGELSVSAAERCSAAVSNDVILIDGEPVDLTVYKIDGANYFKLRDLGRALDFYVGYDEETKIVYISGARGYEEEQGS